MPMPEERGEKGGVVMDDGAEEDQGAQEDEGGLANIEDQKADETIDEPGEAANGERGREDSETGEDGGGEEGEVSEGSQDAGEEDNTRIAALEKEIAEIRAKAQPKEEPVKPLTDEDWVKLEQEWGSPRSTIERITQQNVKVVNHLREYIDGKFAKLEFGSALDSFSKEQGFSDASRYKKEVTEFLADYDPKHWSNPALLKKAVIYARGLNANANVTRARNETERNRVIAGKARPSSPNGGVRRTSSPPLTAVEKEVASMMPGGEAEYRKYRKPGRVLLEE